MWYHHSRKDDSEVIAALSRLAGELPTKGFEVYYKRLRREVHNWNRKRILRVYRAMNLKLRSKHKKRLPARVKNPLEAPNALNEVWSMDFMADVLSDGRKIRVFNVMEDHNQEALAMDVGLNYPAKKVVETLEHLEEETGLPKTIRCDNGPEFISRTLADWCKRKRIELRFIQPGKPVQNAFMERLNRHYREDVLDAYWFNDLHQIRTLTNQWMEDYNTKHPHSALGDMSPREYKDRFGEEFLPETNIINEKLLNLELS
ncbi:IS3 family transposase [Flagellimonas algicola]|uniref:IS3 family transposase n=1 Tax=Flagellimonas algicola TaxID=2583815 RepID=A0ABY2WG94_9FLAO|nr:IS3 family transposase [Allomuricauda algicola]